MSKVCHAKMGGGQTLVEALVATSLIIAALLAILSLAFSTLSFAGQTAERVTAITLGREGIEVCQAIRGSRWLNERESWPFGLENGDWIADSDATTLTAASNSDIDDCNNCKICFNRTTKKYFQADDNGDCGGQSTTPFRRLINISNGDNLGTVCNNDCEKKIRVSIKWTDQRGVHAVTTEKRLTNWR